MKSIRIFLIVFLCLNVMIGFSQESDNQESKKYEINLDNPGNTTLRLINLAGDVSITTSTSNKITIEAKGMKPVPKRADGLKRVSSGGEDNTGVGLNQSKKDNAIELYGTVSMNSVSVYKITVPKNLKVHIELGIFNSGDLVVEGLTSDLEVDVKNSNIKLKEITGPTIISSLSGEIEVSFSTISQVSPFSIKAISGDIDITIPEKTPADLELSSISGEIYSDMDIKTTNEKNNDLNYIGGGANVKAKINNGGVRFMISSISGNIYLRKKK